MRIGFNARYLYESGLRGLNRYTYCLIRALQELPNIEIHLLSEERYPVHEFYRTRLRAQVSNLPASRTTHWEQWVLPRHLKRLDLDVFHAPADGGLPLRKECPYVLTFHGVPDRSLADLARSGDLDGGLSDYLDTTFNPTSCLTATFQGLRARLFRRLYLHAADVVITVSEFSKRELVRFLGLSPEKVRVIPEAADDQFGQSLPTAYIQETCAKYRIPPRYVLFVGGFDKRKNVSTLLVAVAKVREQQPDVALVLVGIGGNVEGCKRQSEALGLQEGHSVFFLQRVPDVELAALYRAASLFTTLSWHEGFCLPLVEAMTCGAPILASSFGAIPEVLGDGGWLVDPRNLEEIVKAMTLILGQTDLRNDLCSRSKLRSRSFSWDRAARETLGVYMHLRPQ